MIYLKTKEELELIRNSSLLVGKALAEVAKIVAPGVKTIDLDKVAEEFIRDNGATPAFKGYRGYKHTLCISPNSQVVHGIPGSYELKEGDVVSVDCGVKMNGFYGDSAYTFTIGEVSSEVKKLLSVTKASLMKAIDNMVAGKRIGDVSYSVQEHAESYGYGVVRELVGHGIGKSLHEDPEVPNYGKRGSGIKLQEGMVFAIEPMINLGKRNVKQENDGWTITTSDGLASAHFEHTVAVGAGKADILSSFAPIEEELKKKNIEVL